MGYKHPLRWVQNQMCIEFAMHGKLGTGFSKPRIPLQNWTSSDTSKNQTLARSCEYLCHIITWSHVAIMRPTLGFSVNKTLYKNSSETFRKQPGLISKTIRTDSFAGVQRNPGGSKQKNLGSSQHLQNTSDQPISVIDLGGGVVSTHHLKCLVCLKLGPLKPQGICIGNPLWMEVWMGK